MVSTQRIMQILHSEESSSELDDKDDPTCSSPRVPPDASGGSQSPNSPWGERVDDNRLIRKTGKSKVIHVVSVVLPIELTLIDDNSVPTEKVSSPRESQKIECQVNFESSTDELPLTEANSISTEKVLVSGEVADRSLLSKRRFTLLPPFERRCKKGRLVRGEGTCGDEINFPTNKF